MIIVTVHLASAVSDDRSTMLARMHITNDGEASLQNARVGDYIGQTFVGRDAATLAKGRVSKRGVIRRWRRLDYHVWNLVRHMLDTMGYSKGQLRAHDRPFVDVQPDSDLLDRLTLAATDPGAVVGFKGERSMGHWIRDALSTVLAEDLDQEVAAHV